MCQIFKPILVQDLEILLNLVSCPQDKRYVVYKKTSYLWTKSFLNWAQHGMVYVYCLPITCVLGGHIIGNAKRSDILLILSEQFYHLNINHYTKDTQRIFFIVKTKCTLKFWSQYQSPWDIKTTFPSVLFLLLTLTFIWDTS